MTSLPAEDYDFQGVIRRNAQYSTPDWPKLVEAPKEAPNVVVIMTDDVGFGASSTFGGPIQTPTFSKLADKGLKYNRFHTTALCSPTRASLLTGRLPHNVSNGTITEWAGGYPGYTTLIPKSCATVARILQCNGYGTSWFGKNHNVPLWESSSIGPFDHWPTGLGFDHFYGFVGADTDQYHPVVYNGTQATDPDVDAEGYHFDSDIADKAIQHIKEHHALTPEKPFFMYYVPGATHAPHHVPQEWIDMYDGAFDAGWTQLRKDTLARMKEMGIVPENTKETKRPPGLQKWDDSDEGVERAVPDERKPYFSKMAETYAGYLSFTDSNIGRVVDAIEELGPKVYDNTLFIYIMGDNGGSAEGTVKGTTNEISTVANYLPEPFEDIEVAIDSGEFGTEMHYNHIPAAWAWAFNAPMQWAKRYASHFGGTRNAMVMSWGKKIQPDDVPRSQFHHVMDILPTILDACGLPESYREIDGFEQIKYDGKSMSYTWEQDGAEKEGIHKEIVFEMFGNRGLYNRTKHHELMWSTTPQVLTWDYMTENTDLKDTDFEAELYDIDGDFSQGTDLLLTTDSRKGNLYKVLAKKMEANWNDLAARNNIFPLSFTDAERVKANSDMPLVTKGKTVFRYPEGILRVPEFCAPSICNINSKIIAHVSLAEGQDVNDCEGCIVKLGGRFGGWGIIVHEGIPRWVYKSSQWPRDIVYEKCGYHLRPGKNTLEIECIYEGAICGTENLGNRMDFKFRHFFEREKNMHPHVGDAYTYRSVPARFGVTETFDVGQNCGSPLHDSFKDKLPFKFNGVIDHVEIILDKTSQSKGLLQKQHEARKKFYVNVD